MSALDYKAAREFAEILNKSNFCPTKSVKQGNEWKNVNYSVEDIIVIFQSGHEIGLNYMQSLKSINSISNSLKLSKDGARALLMKSGLVETLEETYDEVNKMAVCKSKRKGLQNICTASFSLAQARAAGLIKKDKNGKDTGTWHLYPDRMLKARAFSRCASDLYQDVIGGLWVDFEEKEEQVLDIETEQEIKQIENVVHEDVQILNKLKESEKKIEESTNELLKTISEYEVSQDWLDKIMEKANVYKIEFLNLEQQQKTIETIKTKFVKKS